MFYFPGPEGRQTLAHGVSRGNKPLIHPALAAPPLPGGERFGVWGTFIHPRRRFRDNA